MRQGWNPPSPERELGRGEWRDDQLERRVIETEGGQFPIVFRAAIQSMTDPETHRVHYVTDDEGDNVYWDTWDTSFDTTVFNTKPYEQTNDVTEGLVIAGVELLKRGLYSIRAIVDVFPVFNGTSLLKTNYDDGQGEFRYHNNLSPPSARYWGDLYGIQINQWRWVDSANPDTSPPISFHSDSVFGGSASDVEIVLAVNTNVSFGTDADADVDGGSPGDDVWIPGGYDGGWGLVPNLLVAYWGEGAEAGADPSWPGSFPK